MHDYTEELAAAALAGISEDAWAAAEDISGYLPHKPPTAKALVNELRAHPALQAVLASKTGYTPSKWLLKNELAELAARRQSRNMDVIADDRDAYQAAAKSGLMGLCLSGGGIRSATFNLGILQGLAELKLLRCLDYLSSVSGGGYIHQWLAAWAQREGFDTVAARLIPLPDTDSPKTHPEPLRWLRRYSNYLTPELGIFSGDTWVVAATWLRNTLLNQLILITAILPLVLIPHLLIRIRIAPGAPADAAFVLLLCLLAVATWFTGRNLSLCDLHTASPTGSFGQTGVQAGIVAPLLFAGALTALLLPLSSGHLFGLHPLDAFPIGFVLLSAFTLTVTFGGAAPLCYLQSRRDTGHFRSFGQFWRHSPRGRALAQSLPAITLFIAAALLSALVGSGWIVGSEYVLDYLRHLPPHNWDSLTLVLGPPLILSGVLFGLVVLTGLLGRDYFNARREWLARLTGWAGFISATWTVFMGITLLSHAALEWSLPHVKTLSGAVLAWAATTVGGVFSANSRSTSGARDDQPSSGPLVTRMLAVVAPWVFIVGLLILMSMLADLLDRKLGGPGTIVAIVASIAVCLLLAWRVDINEFSMHAFYRDRLARCYLGASNRSRISNPFTGFDDWDTKLPLTHLLPSAGYGGPFPIFCTTLNLTFGEDLAWQERKAASFAFTPLYSGYDVPWTNAHARRSMLRFNGFVRTLDYAYPNPGVHLPTVAAISGAAVSSSQGYHSNPATAFLLTVFNVRLGWWLANPRRLNEDGHMMHRKRHIPGVHQSVYPSPSPRLSLLYLVSELLGRTDDTSQYVNLTDGGHFDNMGLYELIRRRCRYIIICDAEEDGNLQFEGIGMAIRKCRIDFGAEIALDLRPLERAPDSTNCGAHCVTGSIRYPDDPPGTKPGTVVYIKSSLTGDEPADVLNYKKQDPVFPQDSTTNQWFTESQFESYRRLGHHVALAAFSAADPEAFPCTDSVGRAGYFSNLTKIWSAITPEMKEFSPKHTACYGELLEQTRADARMSGLFDMLFERESQDVLRWKTGRSDADADYAVRFCLRFIEFIFTVYLQLRLMYPENREHPFVQGWLDIFRSWGRIDVIQDAWSRYGSGYTRGFQLFAESDGIEFPRLTGEG